MKSSKRVQRLLRRQQKKAAKKERWGQIAVGYARVSSEEQASRGHGLQAQEHAIRAFAESQGYERLDVVRDAGVSGTTPPASREGFAKVLQMAEERAFSILLVWKIDRLARSLVHAVTTANDLRERHEVVLRSVTEPIDTDSPMGQTIFAILAGMAQQERQAITERTLAGKKIKAKRGGFAGAAAPYGYRTDGRGNLVIHEEEANVVRAIYAMREKGATLRKIANYLNTHGVPTRRGGKWHPGTISYMLDNPKYRGEVEYLFRWNSPAERTTATGNHDALVR